MTHDQLFNLIHAPPSAPTVSRRRVDAKSQSPTPRRSPMAANAPPLWFCPAIAGRSLISA